MKKEEQNSKGRVQNGSHIPKERIARFDGSPSLWDRYRVSHSTPCGPDKAR